MGKLQAFVEAGVRFAKDDKREQKYVLEYVKGIVVPLLKEVVRDLCREIDQHHKVEVARDGKPKFVHYTSLGALFSMLQSAAKENNPSLRLYDTVHFNDPEEGYWLVRHLAQKHHWVEQGRAYKSHAYIASFVAPSTDGGKIMRDDLVFWRTYGKEGEGCSLMVSVPNSRLRKVSYGVDETEFAEQTLLPILELLEPLANVSKEIGATLGKAFCESLDGVQYLYKSEAYRYENECRLIVYESEICESRICFEYRDDSPLNIRHYYEHEELRIKEMLPSGSKITIGPCVPHYNDLRQVLEILKGRANMLGPTICRSQILYRRL